MLFNKIKIRLGGLSKIIAICCFLIVTSGCLKNDKFSSGKQKKYISSDLYSSMFSYNPKVKKEYFTAAGSYCKVSLKEEVGVEDDDKELSCRFSSDTDISFLGSLDESLKEINGIKYYTTKYLQ